MKAVLVTGSRFWSSVRSDVSDLLQFHAPDLVLFGDCPNGADMHARVWAEANCIDAAEFRADLDKFGKAAGPMRNKRMVDFFVALPSGWERIALAFPIGDSPGTRGCVRLLKAAGMPIKVVEG